MLAKLFTFERQNAAWEYMQDKTIGKTTKFLAPPGRYCWELERYFTPLALLGMAPAEQHLGPDQPLRQAVNALATERTDWLNPTRHKAQEIFDQSRQLTLVQGHTIVMQRGNRTVTSLLNRQNGATALPDTLDAIAGQFTIDPYTGQPFIYRKTESGFTLYSAGPDADDDGGTHRDDIGLLIRAASATTSPPDSDWVFWPAPDSQGDR